MNLPASTKIRDFIQDIAKRCGYVQDTFLLTYERPDGQQLGEVCIVVCIYWVLLDDDNRIIILQGNLKF